MNESIAGTMRIEIFGSVAAPGVAAAPVAADADGVAGAEEAEGGAGDDSARRWPPFWDVRIWTPRFIDVCPCRSRNVGAVGEA